VIDISLVSGSTPAFYSMMSLRNGLCIDIPGGSTAPGVNPIQYDCNGGDNQSYRLADRGNGTYQIVAKMSGYCLERVSAAVVQNPCLASPNQAWALLPPAAASPAVVGLSRSSAAAGGAAFTLTVNGAGFGSDATVQWNGTALPTTMVSGTQLSASVSGALTVSTGWAIIAVVSGGQTSASQAFPIYIRTPQPARASQPSRRPIPPM
jgi:hypothetical protein